MRGMLQVDTGMDELGNIAEGFALEGDLLSVTPHGEGLIHRSFVVTRDQGGETRRYLLQRINEQVFTQPAALMRNILRVTTHLEQTLEQQGVEDIARRCLRVRRTHGGETLYRDDAGGHWRVFDFIERTRTVRQPESDQQVYEAARAFAMFQRHMLTLADPHLHEVIPHFHATPHRVQQLWQAAEQDALGRAAQVQTELGFARDRDWIAGVLLELHDAGKIPLRVVHNDTKLDNVLFDAASDDALCVVDLDTVMPGLSLYDFGDLVRSCVNAAGADARDPDEVTVRLPLFEAAVHGFLAGSRGFLTPVEIAHLAFSPRLIAYELGVRFLTDYLCGDRYFATSRPAQNLDRCRVQFRLVECLEREGSGMNAVVRSIAG